MEMCTTALGASEVVCTEYLPTVVHYLAFNVKHNAKAIDYLLVCCRSSDNGFEEGCDHCDYYQNCLLSLISKKMHDFFCGKSIEMIGYKKHCCL